MAVQWATIVYEVTSAETPVRYIICHDADAELVFEVIVLPIGADAWVSAVREEHEDSVCSIFRIYYATSLDVQVTLHGCNAVL